ncbi:isochorismatase family cysteine hydrolase [Pseudonocardia spinosispora]|uniref:isochorismatase family cysteine hydrolase n=1 Tax=Pseudonocardia spinosispora TaxID=103441 RepID=UPI000418A253|nr:isochorismatase family cysteine hydrolase [Pseudonocardia spinosispora]
MSGIEYPKTPEVERSADRTGLILIDPYNDFLSEGGKLWPAVSEVAEQAGTLANLKAAVDAARAAGITVFFTPHRRWQEGDYQGWRHSNPSQLVTNHVQLFAEGTWGGDWHPDFQPQPGDVVVSQHWSQSAFANTDLDAQLKQHGIEQLVLVGMIANTCIESTARFGMELGYHVTLVTDATAAFSTEAMHAAHTINGPTFAHRIVTTADLLASLPV